MSCWYETFDEINGPFDKRTWDTFEVEQKTLAGDTGEANLSQHQQSIKTIRQWRCMLEDQTNKTDQITEDVQIYDGK